MLTISLLQPVVHIMQLLEAQAILHSANLFACCRINNSRFTHIHIECAYNTTAPPRSSAHIHIQHSHLIEILIMIYEVKLVELSKLNHDMA